ncbi:MAG: methyltransferase domain-containing protein [Leptolyngbyaceae cyanobacterium RU_5_1]|nr:methyltransferase domain-containing protein [Leptolyngbyaceae cyanobacterium RU_5_1]
MAVRKDTIFERFLAPVVRLFINEEELQRFRDSIDWKMASDRLSNPSLTYPAYYTSQNFHGIEGGYLTSDAAVTYDPITQYALPPSETLVRQALVDSIQSKPRRILDLGCGTGSTTLLLKQAFPQAEVIGLDLSPYMLVVAEHKAQKAGLDIQWRHSKAEATGFPDASFDLVTASLLFHENPPAVSKAILQESYRLLTTGGEVVILDGSQRVLRQTEWLTEIFEEPYIRDYAAESVDAWMGAARFGAVQTQDVWLLNQLTRGVKPLAEQASQVSEPEQETAGTPQWAMG